jgi:hypothetical protein
VDGRDVGSKQSSSRRREAKLRRVGAKQSFAASPGHDGNERANKCKAWHSGRLIWKTCTPHTETANAQVFTALLIVHI